MHGNDHHPNIKVLGFYSPAENVVEFERFVRLRVGWLEAAGYSLDEISRSDVELREALSCGRVIEALVSNADERFNAGDFAQVDANRARSEWQVAWNETYLTSDGDAVLAGYPRPSVPIVDVFRVVFFIHCWKDSLPLVSSYGILSLPPIQPQPERLWRLVPYEIPG